MTSTALCFPATPKPDLKPLKAHRHPLPTAPGSRQDAHLLGHTPHVEEADVSVDQSVLQLQQIDTAELEALPARRETRWVERPEHRACNRAAANQLKTSREW